MENGKKTELPINESFLKVHLNATESDEVRRALAAQQRANPPSDSTTESEGPSEDDIVSGWFLNAALYRGIHLDRITKSILNGLWFDHEIGRRSLFTLGGRCPEAVPPWR